MALCRIDKDSDVYMYATNNDTIVCSGCLLDKVDANEFIYRRDAIAHLKLHKQWGHKVSDYVIEELEEEIKELGNEI